MLMKTLIISNEIKFWLTSSLFSLFIVFMVIISTNTGKHETITEELLTYRTYHLEQKGGYSFCPQSPAKQQLTVKIEALGDRYSLKVEEDNKFIDSIN